MNNYKINTFIKRFFSRIKNNLNESEHSTIQYHKDKAGTDLNELEIKNRALEKRSKELNCLYEVSGIIDKHGITIEELINEVLYLIPPAFQYPKITCVCITYKHKKFKTRKFNITPWKLTAGIYLKRKRKGDVEVYYLKEVPQNDEGPFLADEKKLLNTIARKISNFIEHQETDKALVAEQKRLVRAQKIAHMGDFTWSIKTGAVYWSDALFEMLGYKRHEVNDYARINNEIHHPDDFKWVTNWLQKCIESGEEEHEPMEYRLIRKDGETVYVQTHVAVRYENRKAVELFGTVQNITKRKIIEGERKKSEENFRITLHSIGDAVISTDLKGSVVQMNPVAEKLTGWKFEKAKGKNVENVYRIVDVFGSKEVSTPVEKILKKGKLEGLANHTRLISKDGGEHLIAESGAPILDDNGKITGFVLVFRDITDEYKLQSQLKTNEEILRVAADNINGILYAFDNELNITILKGKKLVVPGVTSKEMVGKSVYDFYKTTDRNHIGIKRHLQVLKGEGIQYEAQLGEYIFSNVISPIKNINNEIIGGVGIAIDITAIRRTEKKQRITQVAVDNSQVGVYQVAEDGTITYVNEYASKNLGYSIEELTGKNILDIDSTFTFQSFQEHRAITRELGKRKIITKHKHKNGNLIPVEVTVNYFELDGEKFTFSFVNDITERVEAERVLKANEEKYRAVFENTGTATCILEKDGTISLANEKFSELAGYPLIDIINRKKWMEFVVKEDLDRMFEQHKLRRTNKEQALTEYDFRFVGRDKTQKYIHLEVDMIPGTDQSVAALLDITQKIEYAKEIEEHERQLYTLMNNLPGMAYRCKNDKYWTMEFVSSGIEKLTGYKPKELIGNVRLSYGELIHEEDWKKVWDAVQETQMNEESFVVEYRIRDKSGLLHWVWEQGKIVEKQIDGSGYIEGFIMDITERKEAEEQLHKLKNDLQNQVVEKTKELSERIKELERFHEATVEREFRIKELREELDKLKENQ